MSLLSRARGYHQERTQPTWNLKPPGVEDRATSFRKSYIPPWQGMSKAHVEKQKNRLGRWLSQLILDLSSIFRTYIQKVRCGGPPCNPSAMEVETEGLLEIVG